MTELTNSTSQVPKAPTTQFRGAQFCFKAMDSIDFLKTNKDESKVFFYLKKVAMAIVTYIALPFFAAAGVVWNTFLTLLNTGRSIYEYLILRDKKQAAEHANQAFSHALFAVADFISSFLPLIVTLTWIIFPDAVNSTNNQIEEWAAIQLFKVEEGEEPQPS